MTYLLAEMLLFGVITLVKKTKQRKIGGLLVKVENKSQNRFCGFLEKALHGEERKNSVRLH